MNREYEASMQSVVIQAANTTVLAEGAGVVRLGTHRRHAGDTTRVCASRCR